MYPPCVSGDAIRDRRAVVSGLEANRAAPGNTGAIHPLGALGQRADEDLAQSVGIETMRDKVFAFTLGGGLAGIAGAFYTQYILFISPVTFTIKIDPRCRAPRCRGPHDSDCRVRA